MTAARRLAAILAADVAGYSRLMGEDEAGTAASTSVSADDMAGDRGRVRAGGALFARRAARRHRRGPYRLSEALDRLRMALSRCQGKNATFHDLSGCQAAATAVRPLAFSRPGDCRAGLQALGHRVALPGPP